MVNFIVGDIVVFEELGKFSIVIYCFDNIVLMLEELYCGGVDVVVGDVGVIKFYIKSYFEKKFKVVGDIKFVC